MKSLRLTGSSALSPRLLLRMLRYHVTSPYILFWRLIEVTVMAELAARQGLDLETHVDLDAGCGNGVLGHALIRDISLGFDLSASAVRWAQRNRPAYRSLLNASATAIPLRDHSQNFVFCNSVIEHIPDDAAALDELARVVAPGGYLLFSTVSNAFPALMLGTPNPESEARNALDQSYVHRHYYSTEQLAAALQKRGLRLLESASYIDARQARWCYLLRRWEHRQGREGLHRRLNQLRRLPVSMAFFPWMLKLHAPSDAGAGLAVIAQRTA